jgi:asparagine synthase (glutamine-hydrolysing)
MCGITGILTSAPPPADAFEARVRAMADTMVHRGPDDSGAWADPVAGVALGQRRLSIIDLSPLGRQPMFSADGRYAIVFNGEIYNYRVLRAELEPLGHAFNGQSDTEVLLAAIVEWGLEAAVARCVGMFAIGLWDAEHRELHLVRDRLGIKPVYWARAGRALVFGSELKSLRAHPDFDDSLDLDALALYFRHNYIPAPYTVYGAARKQRPGTILTFAAPEPGGAIGAPRETVYWSARAAWDAGRADPFPGSEAEAAEEVERLLTDAVGLRMIADVPLGAFLSGGIDSSTVVALMQAQSARPVKTFSIAFAEGEYDESRHAAAVAAHLGTEHTRLTCTPADLLAVVPRIPHHWDEPFSDSSQIPTYMVCKLAREHVTVCLSGDGGDELFAGYGRYGTARVWNRIAAIPLALRRTAALLGPAFPPGGRLRARLDTVTARDFRAFYRHLVSHHKRPAALVPGSREPHTALDDPADDWRALGDHTRAMQYWDLVTYLPDDILTKVDRASMASSLEARVPILDHRVAEFAARLPEAMRPVPPEGKRILRKVLYRHVPRELVERPKMGFGVPLAHWLRHELRDWAGDLLAPAALRRQGLLDASQVEFWWSEHQSGRADRAYYLWDALMLQAWLDARGRA